ncbi:MAG: sensor domain-containing protein [Candidatus Dormibacteria bacterium]|jgi:signal transduction histidine kinase|nr:histidine kinase [Chloroflexota bacterium]HBV94103.1 histidine kinase [Chloroflexota bacterium]
MFSSSIASPAATTGEGFHASDLRRLPAGLASARTWLSTIHLLAGLPIGIATFTVVITGLSLGIGLLPLFLIGIPVLSATIWVATASGQVERTRFALLLGQTISPPLTPVSGGGWWHPIVQPLRTASAWRQVGYCLLRLPVGAIDFSTTLAIWAVPLALITLPAYDAALPGGAASIGGWIIQGPLALTGAVLTGLVLLLAAPLVVRGLASVEIALARLLLGPGSRGLAARVAQLEDSRARVVGAAEAERLRMERDLHDGAQQRLVSVAMELGRAKARFESDPEGARDLIDRAHTEAKEALVELRQLVRGVHPPVLTDRGLDAAVSGLAALSPIPVAVSVEVPERPSLTIESIAYFVVAESLANVAKHARARHAAVDIRAAAGVLSIRVSDDGVGGADPAGGGLTGLASRVAGVDGKLGIDSPPGGPTVIEVELPCAS